MFENEGIISYTPEFGNRRLVEMLLFAGAVYFVLCFAVSQLVRYYQKKLKTA